MLPGAVEGAADMAATAPETVGQVTPGAEEGNACHTLPRGASGASSQSGQGPLQRAASRLSGGSNNSRRPTREELTEQGVPAQEADRQVVRANMEEAFAQTFAFWIFLFWMLFCILIPVQFGLFVWLFIALNMVTGCNTFLVVWGWVVFGICVFNAITRMRHGWCLRRLCCFSFDPENPQQLPLRARIFNFISQIAAPFVWNCIGIHLARVDHQAELPCKKFDYSYFMAVKVYSAFSLAFTLVSFVSMVGLVTLLRYAMQRGLLRGIASTSAAPPGAIDKCCQVVTVADINVEETPSCSICLEDFSGGEMVIVKTDQCGHVFCKACLANWMTIADHCPLCREKFKLPAAS